MINHKELLISILDEQSISWKFFGNDIVITDTTLNTYNELEVLLIEFDPAGRLIGFYITDEEL